MGLLFNLSLRNLFRQKRRNLFLGMGIAFGMMILVIANSFSHGMVDVLINDIVVNAFGHMQLESHPGNSQMSVIRDKARFEKIVYQNIPKEDIINLDESLGMFGQAIGNGESDNVVVVGVNLKNQKDRDDFFKGFFTLVKGNFDDYFSKTIEYPVVISQSKAKSLNVKLHDVIRVRMPMVNGQIQAAKLTVVAIANSNNSFMDIVLFMEAKRVKSLLGYKPWESAGFQFTLKNPKENAKKYADILYSKLKPNLLAINGRAENESATILAFNNDEKSFEVLNKTIRIIAGDKEKAYGREGVLISKEMAEKLRIKPGDEFVFTYPTKFQGDHEEKFKAQAIFEPVSPLNSQVILMNGENIFSIHDRYLPATTDHKIISSKHPLYKILATEWKLLDRSQDSETLSKKYQRERRVRTDQTKIDAITMYEGASDVLKLEGVLNIVTVIAVLILFFIILIGVMNTLRMTIKERTREIGTIRAIGMQKGDVRNMFIMETLQLTFISCIVGFVLALIAMQILGSVRFDVTNALSMILKDKHLFFKLNPVAILFNFILIMVISGITAYFPARRAAKLSAVDALRHYE